jgi:hypothetical protein
MIKLKRKKEKKREGHARKRNHFLHGEGIELAPNSFLCRK